MNNNSVEKYLQELANELKSFPEAIRQDIIEEIRSHIQEALASDQTKTPEAVMAAFGKPKEVAASYARERGLKASKPLVTKWVALTLVCAALIAGFLINAKSRSIRKPKLVSGQASDMPLSEVLSVLNLHSGMNFAIKNEIGQKRISCEYRDVSIPELFKTLSASFSYVKIGDANIYAILPPDSTSVQVPVIKADSPELDKPASLQVKDLPLEELLSIISKTRKVELKLADSSMGKDRITLFAKDVNLGDVLTMICLIENSICEKTNGTYIIRKN